MELEKIIEDGPPEEALDLLAELDYPSWEHGKSKGFIYFTRKDNIGQGGRPRETNGLFIIRGVHDWTVVFAKKAFGASACEKLQLRPGNRRTVASMILGWASGAKVIELQTKDKKMVGAVTEDPSKPGRYRFTRFDEQGPFSHSEGAEPLALLENAWGDGFRVLCRGCVDRIMSESLNRG
jgi:hypothetical protein